MGSDVCSVITGEGVMGTVVVASTILNRVDPVTSRVVPETFTIYSSGLNVDASTGNDHVLNAPLPVATVTIPLAPENSPLWDLDVGLNDEDVISIIRVSPAARLVEPETVNCSPTL